MRRRHLVLKIGTVAVASSLSGCAGSFESSPTTPRVLRIDTDRPIIDGKPSVQDEWNRYATVVTEKTGVGRFNQNVFGTLGINDWKPIEFPEQFISVASVVLPATNTLEFERVELRGNECRYEFRVEENESSDPDLPDPYLFNVVDLWNLNGHSLPTHASIHISGIDEV